MDGLVFNGRVKCTKESRPGATDKELMLDVLSVVVRRRAQCGKAP